MKTILNLLPLILLLTAATTTTAQLRVVYPNGGERLAYGDTIVIRWSGILPTQPVKIEQGHIGVPASWKKLTDSATGGAFVWIINQYPSGDHTIRISSQGSVDSSDSVWAIFTARGTHPEEFIFPKTAVGSYSDLTVLIYNYATININIDTIRITGTDNMEDAKAFEILNPKERYQVKPKDSLLLSVRFKPFRPGLIFGQIIYTTYPWDIRIGLRGTALDTTDSLVILHPGSDAYYGLGDTIQFTWTGNNIPTTGVRLEYSTDNGKQWRTINDSATGTNYTWTVPKTPCTECKTRILGRPGTVIRGDTTDWRWRIDMPNAFLFDHIDIGKANIGQSIEHFSDEFVRNRTHAKVKVQSFSILGEYANEYEVIEGAPPFVLTYAQRWSVRFRFTPKGAGLRKAPVRVLVEDADTGRTELWGIGVDPTSGVDDHPRISSSGTSSLRLGVSPNPASEGAIVQYELPSSSHVRVWISNSRGEEVELLQDTDQPMGVHGVLLNVSELASGTYFVVVATELGRKMEELVVVR